jgi:hypothetical protein
MRLMPCGCKGERPVARQVTQRQVFVRDRLPLHNHHPRHILQESLSNRPATLSAVSSTEPRRIFSV